MDAIVIGNDLIGKFETASSETNADERRRLLTVVVIGGGFSGVEVAGHIQDLMRAMHRFYPELKHESPHVVLLQKGGQLLTELQHESLSQFTLRKLEKNGIQVRLETEAKKVDAVAVHLMSGEAIPTGLVVCTIGTETHPLIKDSGLSLEKGRLKTDPDMKVTGRSNLWSMGDCSLIPNAYNNKPCPATAQFAIQQARQLAENLASALRKARTKPFVFRPRGMLATIGHRNAVAVIYGVKLSGFFVWLLWREIYWMKLPPSTANWKWRSTGPVPSFSPNIVQLRFSKAQPAKPVGKHADNQQKPKDNYEHQT